MKNILLTLLSFILWCLQRLWDFGNLQSLSVSVKMQALVVVFLAVLSAIVMGAPQMSDMQLERTLADRGTMQRHIKCALSEGPCDPVGIRLRTLAPLVLRGSCPQCSAHETRQIRRTLAFVQRNYPWEWAKIVRQYG